MEEIILTLTRFYGLDWLTMVFGLSGAYLLTTHNKLGFVFNIVACICSLAVAVLSGQVGFIVYNLVFMAVMLRGFLNWNRTPTLASS
jgi:hypothetical protein